MKRVEISENKAVSPLIATIILVAITIILAATLYTTLINYASTSNKTAPPAVEISATLSEKCYVKNKTNYQFPYPVCFENNTIFYELKINSINSCNDNLSTRYLEFNIEYKNTSGEFTCTIKPYINTFGRSHMPMCNITESAKSFSSGTVFDIVFFHPVLHMITGSIYLFQPILEKSYGWVYAPENKLYSIEILNYQNDTTLASINIS